MKVLVTGAYGLVGRSLQKVVKNNFDGNEYCFLSRQQCDLRNLVDVKVLFNEFKPDVVIHLASCVGGVYDNMNKNYTYLVDNIKINLNIVECCKENNVTRLINILSTCIFPDKQVTYPLTSDQLHNGLPHDSNIGYAYSKRVLHLASSLLVENQDNNLTVINLTPTNLYGEYDNYNLASSHVIPGLIHKTYLSQHSTGSLQIYGTGKAKRQFLYVDDLSRVILEFSKLDLNSQKNVSCIVSPPESSEITIYNLVENICSVFEFSGEILCDTSYSDGQYKKTTNDDELKKYLPDFNFTPLQTGLKTTIEFFKTNYKDLRK